MTQSITTNILNNIEDIANITISSAGADKFTNFNKIFDNINNITKSKYSADNKTTNPSELNQYLKDTTKESDDENSLNLSLSTATNDSQSQSNSTESENDSTCQVINQNELLMSLNIITEITQNDNTAEINTTAVNTTVELDTTEISNLEIPEQAEKPTENISEITLEEDLVKELNIESIKAETDTESNDSFLQQQTPQEQAVKVMLTQNNETFDVKLQQSVENTQVKPTEISSNKIIEQISKQMESLQNNSKISIVLNPESLGKVTIQLVKSPEGLSAQFTTATQEARELLMKGLDGLKEALTSQGVGVDNVSVKLNDTQKSEDNSNWTDKEGSRGGNKDQGHSEKNKKDKELFEKMIAETQNDKNGEV